MPVSVSHDGTDFLALADAWNALVERDAHGTFFQTPAYLKLYWEEFGEELALSLAFASDDASNQDGAQAPLVGAGGFERIGSTLRFLGGTEVTDYMGPVALDGRSDEVAGAMLEVLAKDPEWSLADLRGLAEDSLWIPSLAKAAGAEGLRVQLEDNDVTPRMPLPDTWEAYLMSLPSKLRHELKRKARKLENDTDGYQVVISDASRLERDLDHFVDLHRLSDGPKGKFMQPGMEIFFRRLAEAFQPDGTFRLAFVEVAGKRVAGAIGFVSHGTFSLYNSALDPEWRSLSPGMVLVGELIKSSIEEGLHTFDMLKGGLEYKYRFGAAPRKLMRLQIAKG